MNLDDVVNLDETLSSQAYADAITRVVAEIAEHRAVIDQAKGVLMAVYDLDAHAAFDLLKWRSQHTNIRLRLLAEHLMTDFRSLQWDQGTLRTTFDQLFLKAYDRVGQEQ